MSKNEEWNFFDELGGLASPEEAAKAKEAQRIAGEKVDYLIHKLFEQTDEGKELLGIWKENLIMKPHAGAGMDYVEIGIKEGMNRFIRGIILTVNRVEAQ